MTAAPQTNGNGSRMLGWVVVALLSIVATGGAAIWSQQRMELDQLRAEVSQLQHDVGELRGKDDLSSQDRGNLHEQVSMVEIRQGRVIGVLSTLAPNATASILRSER